MRATDKQHEAWDLRMAGWTLQRIADHFGVSRERARQIIFHAFRRIDRTGQKCNEVLLRR